MVRNLFGYPIILTATIYLGILNGKTWMILLFFAECILFLAQIIAVIYQKMHLFPKVTLPQAALSGNELALTEISFHNIGLLPVQKLKIRMEYRSFMEGKKKKGRKRKEKVNVWGKVNSEDTQSYEIQSGPFPSGQFLISIPYIRIYDYFGIFSVRVKIGKIQVITILPNFVIMSLILSGKETPIESENDNTKKGQDPTELYDIREYQAGDSLKQIYWKRSASREVLFYRENAAQKGVAAVLFFQLLEQENPILFHYKLKIAGSFMFSLLQKGYLHFIVWENFKENCLERRLIENEQTLYEIIMELLSMTMIKKKKREEKKKKKEKEKKKNREGKTIWKREKNNQEEDKKKNDSIWQDFIRIQYQMQFYEDICPESFFLISKKTAKEKKEVLILEQETELLKEFLKGKKLKGNKQEEQELEEEMRGL